MHISVVLFCFRAVLEAVVGILMRITTRMSFEEIPMVNCANTIFNKRVVQHMQPTLERFVPAPWAPWGCSQTVFSQCAQISRESKFPYTRRQHVRAADGVELHIDWKEKPDMLEDTLLVIVLHGIGGSSASKVARITCDMAMDRGWRSAVYVRRGHGDSSLLPQPPLSDGCIVGGAARVKSFPMHCDLDDMNTIIRCVQIAFPSAPKVIVGFSAGANVVVKYLGSGITIPPQIIAAVSVCNGHELVSLTREYTHRPAVNALMTSALQSVLKKRSAEVKRIAEVRGVALDFGRLFGTKDVREFDEMLMLPLYRQFTTIDEYYAFNSCHTAFGQISTPLLCMAALDDPLIRSDLSEHAVCASAKNSNIISVITERGGHLGWLTGWSGVWWQQDLIFSYITSVYDMYLCSS